MAEMDIRTKDLEQECASLRKENSFLTAKLAHFDSVFQKMEEALLMLKQLDTEVKRDNVVKALLIENRELKNRLQIERLTNREKEVLKYISNGYTSKEIALQMDISKLTVDTYRKHIQKKLKVSNVVELVTMAKDSGFG